MANAYTNQLMGKVAIITGAGSGIGKATALLFASYNARVAAVDLNIGTCRQTESEIRQVGGDALSFQADMTDVGQVGSMVNQVVSHFGQVDILVNVAGGSGRKWGDGPTHLCTEEGWNRTTELNLKSVFLGCKFAISAMLVNGGGVIVNISSILGLVGGDQDFATHAYAASKGGVISLTRSIAAYYAPQNIRANVICPGLIATAMSRRAQESDHIRDRLPTLQPLTGNFGRPEDVAHAALYLASETAAFVTGAVLTVDGGWTVL
jgi:NAD(P)-dependent dehydrogenase (short-subunit alcohol dehydrogenase family)